MGLTELASEGSHVTDEALDEADDLADLALLLGDGGGGESTGDESRDGEEGELHFVCCWGLLVLKKSDWVGDKRVTENR